MFYSRWSVLLSTIVRREVCFMIGVGPQSFMLPDSVLLTVSILLYAFYMLEPFLVLRVTTLLLRLEKGDLFATLM